MIIRLKSRMLNPSGVRGRGKLSFLVRKSLEDVKSLHPHYGEVKEPSILYIGPAGENRARVAAVVSKYAHAAG